MTISYNWLSEYLPVTIEPERLSRILTSIGLEVESMKNFEEIRGGLKGLVVGHVLTADKHPNADKLTLTTVDIGQGAPLQIVCGAPNVAAGQKVVVAPVGTTIFPVNGEPVKMKNARIRGSESQGMICAEDEIGLGESHAGIIVLPENTKTGSRVSELFSNYSDIIYEIGLTPNRMDAMSHWGVAKDVCAYLTHHDKKEFRPKLPYSNSFKPASTAYVTNVKVENTMACPRYSGLNISGVTVGDSPKWLQDKLKSIGLRPINNIVDITNFIQHETGQPLHAFDAEKISGNQVIVKNLPAGTPFTTLDEKERKLDAEDLMICDDSGGICIAGVFGGLHSGVTTETKNIFLESACFHPVYIRKTSFRHGLRTDAATRFEKGTDISNTVNVLKRAALLIREICGGEFTSDITDIYPEPRTRQQLSIKYHFLKKLSGKSYHPDAVKNILVSLGFEVMKEGIDELHVAVPFNKPDISMAADLVEEIMRIDGLDNIEIPSTINISPSVEEDHKRDAYREKTSDYLAANGFFEIMTNSITNSTYFTGEELSTSVKMLNSLSAGLDIMRPSMLHTGLSVIAHNLNRKNNDLKLFEFGNVYSTSGSGKYIENQKLAIYITGDATSQHWKNKASQADIYFAKGMIEHVLRSNGITNAKAVQASRSRLDYAISYVVNGEEVAYAGPVSSSTLNTFDIRQPVYYAELDWEKIQVKSSAYKLSAKELAKFPAVNRDLAVVVPSSLAYEKLEESISAANIRQLETISLFDIFENEKIGKDKKSIAVSLVFQDPEKTLTDKEIDTWMNSIMSRLEKDLQAEIRK